MDTAEVPRFPSPVDRCDPEARSLHVARMCVPSYWTEMLLGTGSRTGPAGGGGSPRGGGCSSGG